jgi:hypothetical protein
MRGSRIEGNSIDASTRAWGGRMSLSTSTSAPLTIEDSAVNGNTAETDANIAEGGGLRISSLPTTIRRSLIDANSALSDGTVSWGGGLSLFTSSTAGPKLVVVDSTISRNRAAGTTTVTEGGGIRAFNTGPGPILAAQNTTVSGNSAEAAAGEGGGLRVQGATLDHVTVASNTAAVAANFKDSSAGGATSFSRSVLTDPLGGGTNCALGINPSDGYSSDDDSCNLDQPTDLADLDDSLLGQLRDNGDVVAAAEVGGTGEPRPTMFPLNGSPLIDAIPAGSCSVAPELDLDERGVDRPFGSGCDIGAIESVFPTHGFSDVSPFFEDAVRWTEAQGIFDGFPDLTYRQNNPINRGNASRTAYNLAQTKPAWADTMTAPANMLFKSNLP